MAETNWKTISFSIPKQTDHEIDKAVSQAFKDSEIQPDTTIFVLSTKDKEPIEFSEQERGRQTEIVDIFAKKDHLVSKFTYRFNQKDDPETCLIIYRSDNELYDNVDIKLDELKSDEQKSDKLKRPSSVQILKLVICAKKNLKEIHIHNEYSPDMMAVSALIGRVDSKFNKKLDSIKDNYEEIRAKGKEEIRRLVKKCEKYRGEIEKHKEKSKNYESQIKILKEEAKKLGSKDKLLVSNLDDISSMRKRWDDGIKQRESERLNLWSEPYLWFTVIILLLLGGLFIYSSYNIIDNGEKSNGFTLVIWAASLILSALAVLAFFRWNEYCREHYVEETIKLRRLYLEGYRASFDLEAESKQKKQKREEPPQEPVEA